jgi:sestrin
LAVPTSCLVLCVALSGMSHDDYNYHEVNIYLNKRIKQYIKKVACYPESIVPSDFHHMGFTFRPDEKCQINLLASEARKCAELVYALHALMKC